MKSLFLLFVLISVCFLSACQTIVISQRSSLMNTVEQQVLPYLDTQLNKPRFQQRPIMLVKFTDGQIETKMDTLTRSLRQRIETYLLKKQGIVLYRSSNDLVATHQIAQRKLCLKRPELFLGIEIKSSGSKQSLSLRMLDKQQDNRWVDGFGLTQSIALTNSEQAQLNSVNPDPWLTGLRESPYTVDAIDLMVKDLGKQLNCQLMKHASPSSIYIDVTKMPDNGLFKQVISLLKTDLPTLTGVTVSNYKVTDKMNEQIILSLGWITLNKQDGRGRLSMTVTQSKHHSLEHISAVAYLTGVNDIKLNNPDVKGEYEVQALPVIILDSEYNNQSSAINHPNWTVRF
ncbi:MAG TPA: hypothetical protein ENJ60_08265 [Aeromonadales bacterium]|nr:hypothetical protein [Aeromonadales bacterium]